MTLGEVVGCAGLEQPYDAVLRGVNGRQCLYVDPRGVPVALGERRIRCRVRMCGSCSSWASSGSWTRVWPRTGPRYTDINPTLPECGAGMGKMGRRGQATELAAVRETGLMWAKALRAFQVGKARTSHEGPWSWMRRSRVASAQLSWPACHLTKASASAVM